MKMMLKMTGAILNSMAYSRAVKFYSLFLWTNYCFKTAVFTQSPSCLSTHKKWYKWRTAKVLETTRVCTAHCDLNLKLRDHDQAEIRTKMFWGNLKRLDQIQGFLEHTTRGGLWQSSKCQAVSWEIHSPFGEKITGPSFKHETPLGVRGGLIAWYAKTFLVETKVHCMKSSL